MSETELFQSPWNFLGLPEEVAAPDRARGRLMPVPYEATTSYGAGTRDGPAAIIAASRQVELFDREFGGEPAMEYGVHTMSPLNPVQTSPEAMAAAVEQAVSATLSASPRPEALAILGGEHSITPAAVRGLARHVDAKKLVCVQVDAHADLRDEYEGSPWSHACAARRIVEVCPVYQIGIRNISASEEPFRKRSKRVTTVFAEEAADPRGAFLKDLARFVRALAKISTSDT